MKKAIFLRELRVGLLQELVAAGGVLGMLTAVGWVYDQSFRDIKEALPMILFPLIALLAFSSGARTFMAESRRRQERFFYTLPISRGALWFSLVGGRLAASLPMVTLLFLIGSLLRRTPLSRDSLGAGALALYVLPFASGCCFSLPFRRATVAYLTGLWFVFLVQFIDQILQGFYSDVRVVSYFLLSATFLLLSWFFFHQGELHSWARQITHFVLLVVALMPLLLLLGAPFLLAYLDEHAIWKPEKGETWLPF